MTCIMLVLYKILEIFMNLTINTSLCSQNITDINKVLKTINYNHIDRSPVIRYILVYAKCRGVGRNNC